VPERRRRFERTISSRVIEPRQFQRGLVRLMHSEIISCRIIAMRQRKHPVISTFDRDLPDAPPPLGQPISERAFLREGAHFKAWAIRKAACSRKSRSFSVNALSFSLSTSMRPTGFPDSVITGTTISDWVLPNVGK